jgi:hypothetical protein
VPLAWRVRRTEGAIGFEEQRAALDAVARLLPEGARPVLMGDRFYGSPALIAWCRAKGWAWRLRLKHNLLVFEQGGESTLGEKLWSPARVKHHRWSNQLWSFSCRSTMT